MENFVITIARGYGTGGKEIADKVAAGYGIECYESRIVTLASRLSGIDADEFREIDEKLRKKSLWTLIKRLPVIKDADAVLHSFVSDSMLFEYQAKIIRDLADRESCVIVGKCADYVLKDRENILRVYIEAPREFARERIMKKDNVNADTADYIITSTDQYRADYYAYYTNGNYWTNPINYDITLNSGTLGIDGAVDVIRHCLEVKLQEE